MAIFKTSLQLQLQLGCKKNLTQDHTPEIQQKRKREDEDEEEDEEECTQMQETDTVSPSGLKKQKKCILYFKYFYFINILYIRS